MQSTEMSNGEVPAVIVDIPALMESSRRRKIHRVPPQLLMKQNIYDPVMVSLGPYHHGKPHLRHMEEYKRETLALFLSGSGLDKGFFYSKILERIDDVRSFYLGVTAEEFDDATLCKMMLLDACFLICCMKVRIWDNIDMYHAIRLKEVLKVSDIDKLENQIPYWVIRLLACSGFGEDFWKDLLCKYLSGTCFGLLRGINQIPWQGGGKEEPLHLLEANRRVLAGMGIRPALEFHRKNKGHIANYENLSHQFHSVTHLKRKGIHFEPSSYCCLKDIIFISHTSCGHLMLPVRFLKATDKILFSNMIAFEMSPGIVSDFAVTSYVTFMKSLVTSPQDSMELREKGILYSNLDSDEEVVDLFREVDTMGLYLDFFDNVKKGIEDHCNHKSNTWIAQLINIDFRTVVALVVGAVLLVSTFLRTYYIVRAAWSSLDETWIPLHLFEDILYFFTNASA